MGACDRKKQKHVGRVTAAKRCARCNITYQTFIANIYVTLNNPKAARVFTREIKSHVQRPDGNFLFTRCRRNLFCPASALTFVFIYHRALSAWRGAAMQ